MFATVGALTELAVWLTTRPDTGTGEARVITWTALKATLVAHDLTGRARQRRHD